MKMGPVEAANAIRSSVQSTTMDPSAHHQANYLAAVCGNLGLDPSPANLQHVYDVLRLHDIEIPTGDEYPKYIGKLGDRDLIATGPAHEAELREELGDETEEDLFSKGKDE